MSKYRLACIKCSEVYSTDDPDPYYCAPCEVEKKKVAAKIDAQLGPSTNRSHSMSDLQAFEASAKTFIDPSSGRTVTFGRA